MSKKSNIYQDNLQKRKNETLELLLNKIGALNEEIHSMNAMLEKLRELPEQINKLHLLADIYQDLEIATDGGDKVQRDFEYLNLILHCLYSGPDHRKEIQEALGVDEEGMSKVVKALEELDSYEIRNLCKDNIMKA